VIDSQFADSAVRALIHEALPFARQSPALKAALAKLEGEPVSLAAWVSRRRGPNWVISYQGRTARVRAKYGEGVHVFTPRAWQAERAAYEAETGRKAPG
jgi:hypothetical protein